MERLPTPVFWPGEFYGLYSPWGHKESDTTEQLSLSNVFKSTPPPNAKNICKSGRRSPHLCQGKSDAFTVPGIELGIEEHPEPVQCS